MSSDAKDELLRAYQRELAYLRGMGAEFARKYPKIAARLDLSAETCADPHVERLIESFAFLTARLQSRLDADFPLVTTSILECLYPHLLQTIPSMSIAHFDVDPEQGLPLGGFTIGKGAKLFAQTDTGALCRFRTGADVTLWPISIVSAQLESTDRYPYLDAYPKGIAMLRLKLECQTDNFGELDLRSIRVFVNSSAEVASAIYDLLVASTVGVVLLPDGRPEVQFLGPSALRPVGLEKEDSLLPSPEYAHPAYRLLQEYFVFPQKFLFFDIDLPRIQLARKTADVLILLSEAPPRSVAVTKSTFMLGCAPIINLFPKTAEPIRLTHRLPEYPLVADKREEKTCEIHSIDKVSQSADPNSSQNIAPFFSFNHPASGEQHQAFYYAQRRPTGRADLGGLDTYLSFVDMRFKPTQPATQTVFAHTLCTNRDLAAQMPARARLQMEDAAPVKAVTCLSKPTEPITPPLGGAALWQLVSHLSLNHLSLIGGRESRDALREILRLYRMSPTTATENQILGITELQCIPKTLQAGRDAWRGFVHGQEVQITFDEGLYVGHSALMMSAVLSRFFGLYTAVNSFTMLVVRSRQRQEAWKKWPPLAGARNLL
ncbi:MAG TPA: type VI secretion system baseplate subunit TssF [Pseudomonadota bacterium]|jgi:type VI secretion system protein ImpG|nr:type VI secretion system baseplate subunit TssF [Pseudomonadota bacterium]